MNGHLAMKTPPIVRNREPDSRQRVPTRVARPDADHVGPMSVGLRAHAGGHLHLEAPLGSMRHHPASADGGRSRRGGDERQVNAPFGSDAAEHGEALRLRARPSLGNRFASVAEQRRAHAPEVAQPVTCDGKCSNGGHLPASQPGEALERLRRGSVFRETFLVWLTPPGAAEAFRYIGNLFFDLMLSAEDWADLDWASSRIGSSVSASRKRRRTGDARSSSSKPTGAQRRSRDEDSHRPVSSVSFSPIRRPGGKESTGRISAYRTSGS